MTTLLTGIKPTGDLHLGNYLGAIEPAISAVQEHEQSFVFVADYHALNSHPSAEQLRVQTRSIAAALICCGLDLQRTALYRQSSVAATFELATILASFVPKSVLNAGHAYRTARQRNIDQDQPEDAHINIGLFTYPLLMAADILLMGTDVVPVGSDQLQHVEVAKDIAQRFNSFYNTTALTIPQPVVKQGVGVVPGLDGRKMSKSYGNVIALFAGEKAIKSSVSSIVTDSTPLGQSIDAEANGIYQIYRLVANASQAQAMKDDFEAGSIGYGHAKARLNQTLQEKFTPLQQQYQDLLQPDSVLDDILDSGAEKANARAQQTISAVRTAVGL